MRIALFRTLAERTKYIHAQRLFRFLAQRHKTLAKRLVAETAGHLLNTCNANGLL